MIWNKELQTEVKVKEKEVENEKEILQDSARFFSDEQSGGACVYIAGGN
jgi:hypothetical protein